MIINKGYYEEYSGGLNGEISCYIIVTATGQR